MAGKFISLCLIFLLFLTPIFGSEKIEYTTLFGSLFEYKFENKWRSASIEEDLLNELLSNSSSEVQKLNSTSNHLKTIGQFTDYLVVGGSFLLAWLLGPKDRGSAIDGESFYHYAHLGFVSTLALTISAENYKLLAVKAHNKNSENWTFPTNLNTTSAPESNYLPYNTLFQSDSKTSALAQKSKTIATIGGAFIIASAPLMTIGALKNGNNDGTDYDGKSYYSYSHASLASGILLIISSAYLSHKATKRHNTLNKANITLAPYINPSGYGVAVTYSY